MLLISIVDGLADVDGMSRASEDKLVSENSYERSFDCFNLAVSLAAFLQDLEVAATKVFFFVVEDGVFLFFVMHFITLCTDNTKTVY